MATTICTAMNPVVGPARRNRLGPMGAVKSGWDKGDSKETAHSHGHAVPFLSGDRRPKEVS